MSAITPACGAPACVVNFTYIPLYETMLTVEDGTIVTGADTYADADDVSTYATRYGFSWNGTDLAKEQAILRAMIYIESFEPRLCGSRVGGVQELAWPRDYVPNKAGTAYISETTVPSDIVNAVAEAAILELATPGVLTASIDADSIGVKRVRDKVGPLESEIEYNNRNSAQRAHYTRILEFLRHYICTGSLSSRITRS